ncbi:MAG: glycosyltransferase family 2 protein [Candidatus Binatia bacterium]|nr:glycosyltransferase family 2 protein [Candidatus Binatia bacterium]
MSIIILTWNSLDVIRACLSSLPQGLARFTHEVIVIDNGSRDPTPAIFRREFPWMRLVINRRNLGVARARNQGIVVSQGEYIILLDDDTIVQPGALDVLIEYLETHPQVGLCGPKLVDLEGRLHFSCRLFPTLTDKVARRLPFPSARNWRRTTEMMEWDHQTPRAVDYVIGACQAIRRQALAQVGLLDERIFYGPEDVDLCLRLQLAGWLVVYQPQSVVVHRERRVTRWLFSRVSGKHAWGVLYYFWKHRYLFSRRRLYARFPTRQPADVEQQVMLEQSAPRSVR